MIKLTKRERWLMQVAWNVALDPRLRAGDKMQNWLSSGSFRHGNLERGLIKRAPGGRVGKEGYLLKDGKTRLKKDD